MDSIESLKHRLTYSISHQDEKSMIEVLNHPQARELLNSYGDICSLYRDHQHCESLIQYVHYRLNFRQACYKLIELGADAKLVDDCYHDYSNQGN